MSSKFSARLNFMTRVYNTILFIALLSVTTLLYSCEQVAVFEKNVVFPKDEWSRKFESTGSFQIADTISAYNIYVVLRHRDSYNYNNIWVDLGLQSPGDSMYRQKINLTLGNDAGWEGSGMNDIWEVRKLITTQPRRFKRAGTYNFAIRQIMRDDPLTGIMSAGLRIQKKE